MMPKVYKDYSQFKNTLKPNVMRSTTDSLNTINWPKKNFIYLKNNLKKEIKHIFSSTKEFSSIRNILKSNKFEEKYQSKHCNPKNEITSNFQLGKSLKQMKSDNQFSSNSFCFNDYIINRSIIPISQNQSNICNISNDKKLAKNNSLQFYHENQDNTFKIDFNIRKWRKQKESINYFHYNTRNILSRTNKALEKFRNITILNKLNLKRKKNKIKQKIYDKIFETKYNSESLNDEEENRNKFFRPLLNRSIKSNYKFKMLHNQFSFIDQSLINITTNLQINNTISKYMIKLKKKDFRKNISEIYLRNKLLGNLKNI